MTLSRKLMVEGEQSLTTTRTHVKVLALPFLAMLVVAGAAGYLAARLGDRADGIPRWIVIGVAVVLLLWLTVVPFLRWYLWTYTLTNKRLVEQKGILTRTGRVIPLSRINDVSFEKNLNDRILGCGTLIVHDASEQEGLRLRDIPGIEDFHRTVTGLVDQAHARGEGL
ncbi:MAG: PH domain-containing protein [Aeromicrobium erythreum]